MQIALWKRIFIWGLCALALFYASPNLFYPRVERHNDAIAKIAKDGETPELAADRAGWPSWAPSQVVNLGLDLRGGAHLLAEVHVADVYKARMNSLWPELRKALTAERATVGGVRRAPGPDDELRVQIEKPEGMPKALEIANGLSSPVITLTGVGQKDRDERGDLVEDAPEEGLGARRNLRRAHGSPDDASGRARASRLIGPSRRTPRPTSSAPARRRR